MNNSCEGAADLHPGTLLKISSQVIFKDFAKMFKNFQFKEDL